MVYYINKMKKKNHMIISIDVERAFEKTQHPFIIKSWEETCLNITKAEYDKYNYHIIMIKS